MNSCCRWTPLFLGILLGMAMGFFATVGRGETLVANARPVLTKAALTNTLAGAYVEQAWATWTGLFDGGAGKVANAMVANTTTGAVVIPFQMDTRSNAFYGTWVFETIRANVAEFQVTTNLWNLVTSNLTVNSIAVTNLYAATNWSDVFIGALQGTASVASTALAGPFVSTTGGVYTAANGVAWSFTAGGYSGFGGPGQSITLRASDGVLNPGGNVYVTAGAGATAGSVYISAGDMNNIGGGGGDIYLTPGVRGDHDPIASGSVIVPGVATFRTNGVTFTPSVTAPTFYGTSTNSDRLQGQAANAFAGTNSVTKTALTNAVAGVFVELANTSWLGLLARTNAWNATESLGWAATNRVFSLEGRTNTWNGKAETSITNGILSSANSFTSGATNAVFLSSTNAAIQDILSRGYVASSITNGLANASVTNGILSSANSFASGATNAVFIAATNAAYTSAKSLTNGLVTAAITNGLVTAAITNGILSSANSFTSGATNAVFIASTHAAYAAAKLLTNGLVTAAVTNGILSSAKAYTDSVTNGLSAASGSFPMFVLGLGDNWTDFELKATTNNFTGGSALVYFYMSSLSNSLCDDPDPYVYFTDSGAADKRVWKKQTAHASILSQLTDGDAVANQVIVFPSLQVVTGVATNSSAAWLTATNPHLIWSYVRYDGVDYERDPAGRSIWTPVAPVAWKTQRTTP